jgi:hypothetical protein
LVTQDIVSTIPIKDIVVTGGFVVVPNPRKPIASPVCTLQAWDIVTGVWNSCIMNLQDCSQSFVGHALSFDGTRMFCRYTDDSLVPASENHVLAPCHPAELVINSPGSSPQWRPRYAVVEPWTS